jgi:hypothetical protein
VVADMCEALGRPRPSQLGEERRHLLVAWLLTTPGRAALSHAASGRARLLETAREYPRKTLQMAALSAGLVDPKSGKPRSAPASLSARELWQSRRPVLDARTVGARSSAPVSAAPRAAPCCSIGWQHDPGRVDEDRRSLNPRQGLHMAAHQRMGCPPLRRAFATVSLLPLAP